MTKKEQQNQKELNVEFADIDESSDQSVQEILNNSKQQNPIWKGKNVGQTLIGTVSEVLTFLDLNGKGKHGILYNFSTKNDKFPKVSVWLNSVLISGFKRYSSYKPVDSQNFDEITKTHNENVGKKFAIRFEGKIQPQTKGFKEYDNYTITQL